jgi:hypothetical protein
VQRRAASSVASECVGRVVPPVPSKPAELLLPVDVYKVAKKYEVSELKALAKKKFALWCAKDGGDPVFVQAAKKVFEDFDEEDMELREVVIEVLAQ